MVASFHDRGWAKFNYDAVLADWVAQVLPAARSAVSDPNHALWHDCEGTWFIGVDALQNDTLGRVGDSAVLSGEAFHFAQQQFGPIGLHKAQVSVIYPGYPQPRRGENKVAALYRSNRDAAHVDGLKPVGPDRRRRVDEPHAWVLGIPLTEASADASPMVVWDGSHKVLGEAFRQALDDVPQNMWGQIDITDIYKAARREVFQTCPRFELYARPGEAYLMHRHCLHGVAPWGPDASAEPDGRMIAYFRPELPGGVAQWIESP
ncbi:hypothetical protein SAMN05444358_101311 [Ruegeria halocynthiae]|uniref:Phytanoyl-CoA dioxygenase (PhyH) n=1 Tax=Ruegeria halocynthiae TaxID=985054 RepID=A0A1H2RZV8_9RHOB|nr:hypothetical protein [Ruegeria halocynthiae]SDW24720.1 hypothetical protein SAMN05444358_101311 [Ruegeria halocynthiae]